MRGTRGTRRHIGKRSWAAFVSGLVLCGSVVPVALDAAAGPSTTGSVTIAGSMEGNLQINPGDTLRVGYDFTGLPIGTVVSVTQAQAVFLITCPNGSASPLTISIPDQTYTVTSGDWTPTGDQSSILTYQGFADNVHQCGAQVMRDEKGTIFSANFATSTGGDLNVRYHYADYFNRTSTSWSGTATVHSGSLTSTLTGHIYDCTGGATTTEVPGGSIAAAGPTTVAATANPMSSGVAPGQYTETATPPAGFHLVVCGGGDTVNPAGTSATSPAITVPLGGTGNGVFYVAPNPGTLTGHIYDCTSGATTTEVPGGSIAAAGPTTVAATANPMSSGVAPGQYTETATPPAGFHLVVCGGGDTVNPAGTSATSPAITVPLGGTGNAIFYVTPSVPAYAITKTVTPTGTVPVGTALTYVVTVANTGTADGSPGTLTDVITTSGGVTYHVDSGPTPSAGPASAVTGSDPSWSWAVPVIPMKGSVTLTTHLTVTGVGPTGMGAIDNTATLAGLPPATTHTPVVAPVLAVTKTVDHTVVNPGDPVTYTVTVTNTGPVAATNVLVTDVMSGSAGVLVEDGEEAQPNTFNATPALVGGVVKDGHGAYHWTFASISAGGQGVVTFVARVLAPTTVTSAGGSFVLVNTATVPGLPPASVTTTIVVPPNTTPPTGVPPASGVAGVAAAVAAPETGSRLASRIALSLILGGAGLAAIGLSGVPRRRRLA